VSDSGRSATLDMRFVLAPAPPIRSLAISAVVAVISVALIVIGGALQLPQVVTIVGVGLMTLAVVLALVALLLTVRLRTILILNPQSITIIKGRRGRVIPWSEIDRVRMQGAQLLLLITKPEDGPDATVIYPRATTDATFSALITEIQKRLDADRGYQRLS
jgi:hypothetical protein